MNRPVVDLGAALEPSALAAWLEYAFAEHIAVTDALMERNEKFLAVTASGIPDEFVLGHAADFCVALKAAAAALDAARVTVKGPVLLAGRMIDGRAREMADRLAAAVAVAEGRVRTFLLAKEEASRAAAAMEAERLAEASAMVPAAEIMDVLDRAEAATERASAPSLELTRTRSLTGSLAALREVWTYEVVDVAAVPRAYLMINDRAVRAAVSGGTREVPGLRIFAEKKAMTR